MTLLLPAACCLFNTCPYKKCHVPWPSSCHRKTENPYERFLHRRRSVLCILLYNIHYELGSSASAPVLRCCTKLALFAKIYVDVCGAARRMRRIAFRPAVAFQTSHQKVRSWFRILYRYMRMYIYNIYIRDMWCVRSGAVTYGKVRC